MTTKTKRPEARFSITFAVGVVMCLMAALGVSALVSLERACS